MSEMTPIGTPSASGFDSPVFFDKFGTPGQHLAREMDKWLKGKMKTLNLDWNQNTELFTISNSNKLTPPQKEFIKNAFSKALSDKWKPVVQGDADTQGNITLKLVKIEENLDSDIRSNIKRLIHKLETQDQSLSKNEKSTTFQDIIDQYIKLGDTKKALGYIKNMYMEHQNGEYKEDLEKAFLKVIDELIAKDGIGRAYEVIEPAPSNLRDMAIQKMTEKSSELSLKFKKLVDLNKTFKITEGNLHGRYSKEKIDAFIKMSTAAFNDGLFSIGLKYLQMAENELDGLTPTEQLYALTPMITIAFNSGNFDKGFQYIRKMADVPVRDSEGTKSLWYDKKAILLQQIHKKLDKIKDKSDDVVEAAQQVQDLIDNLKKE